MKYYILAVYENNEIVSVPGTETIFLDIAERNLHLCEACCLARVSYFIAHK